MSTSPNNIYKRAQGPGYASRGLSLVELMVAMTVGLIIMAAVFILFSKVSSTARNTDDSAQAMENGNFSLRVVGEDLRMSGFIGVFNDPARIELQSATLVASAAAKSCGSAAWPFQLLNATNQATYIEYYPKIADSIASLPCLTSDNIVASSPALVLRHASGAQVRDPNNDGNLSDAFDGDNQLYLQSSIKGAIIFRGADYKDKVRGVGLHRTILRNGVAVDAPVFPYLAHVYYIRPCSRPAGSTCTSSDDKGSPIPTLVRRQLSEGSPAEFVETAIAEGVERMTVSFGVDNNGDGVPDRYTSTPDNLENVMTARVSLLLRTPRIVAGHNDGVFTYTLSNGDTFNCTTANVDCAYRRFLFNDTIQLKNYVYRRQ